MYGIVLLSMMLMGFRLKEDIFILSTLVGLKLFSELILFYLIFFGSEIIKNTYFASKAIYNIFRINK